MSLALVLRCRCLHRPSLQYGSVDGIGFTSFYLCAQYDATVRKIIGQNEFGGNDIAKVPSTVGIKSYTTVLLPQKVSDIRLYYATPQQQLEVICKKLIILQMYRPCLMAEPIYRAPWHDMCAMYYIFRYAVYGKWHYFAWLNIQE